jgi:predicted DNA-binding protein YlxM (UPF0122 family)
METTKTNESPATDNLPEEPNRIDLALAIDLRFKHNLSYREIAARLGVCHQAVQQRLNSVIKLLGEPDENNAYDKNRAHFLTGIERQLIKQLIDKNKIKKATLGNVAYALDKVNNILRLERGQATNNQAIQIQVIRFSDKSIAEAGIELSSQVVDITSNDGAK